MLKPSSGGSFSFFLSLFSLFLFPYSSTYPFLPLRAISFFRQNRFEVSKKHLREAIKFDPDNKLAKNYLKKIKKYTKGLEKGNRGMEERKWEEALEGFRGEVIPTLEEEAKTAFVSKAIENSEDIR